MDESPATRRSLIVKLRDPADSAAWSEFVAIYEPLVYRLARRKGLQDADAHDLCQEVFQAVARAIDRWEPGRGSFRGWLSRIARNLLINFLTRRQYQPRGTGATSIQDLLEAQPAADPSATALFEAEYERRLFRWAAERGPGRVHARDLAGVLADRGRGPSARRGRGRARALGRGRLRRAQPGPGPAQAADRAVRATKMLAIMSEVDHEDPERPL